jgi:nucleotide-binding universal stress UspA family protein
MLRDIVVALAANEPGNHVENYAISLARLLNAHLVGIAFAYVIQRPHTFDIAAKLLEDWRIEKEKAADAAVSSFANAAREASIAAESHKITTNVVEACDMFASIARRFDMSIVGQSEPHKGGTTLAIIEAALFSSGRPVIVVPYGYNTNFRLNRITVCWDGSRYAVRAIADAMPLLHQAREINLLTVTGELPKSEESPYGNIAQYFVRHGLPISVTAIEKGEIGVTNTILNFATAASTDLLVMGGYGHPRMREIILGGVTRDMLQAMKMPVLMSH